MHKSCRILLNATIRADLLASNRFMYKPLYLSNSHKNKSSHELRKAVVEFRMIFVGVGVFSAAVNLLMLIGPLFMLQVYDRVLTSHSTATLLVLFLIVVFLYFIMGVLDHYRGRVLARIGAGVQTKLDQRVFQLVLRQAEHPTLCDRPAEALKDLAAIRAALSSPATGAVFDLPWTPFYIGVMFLFHLWLGWFSVASTLLIFVFAVLNGVKTRRLHIEAGQQSALADTQTELIRHAIETVRGLGMIGIMTKRWQTNRDAALQTNLKAVDTGGLLSTTTKTIRLLLQSTVLALGALLVLRGQLTPGVMIAGSILLGRALAPVDQVVGQWSLFQKAAASWKTLTTLLEQFSVDKALTKLPHPKAKLSVENLAVIPPSETSPVLQGVSFSAESGDAIGIIGPSSSGKTSLARALVGFWKPTNGEIRLDGAVLNQYESDRLGCLLGYLPQDVKVFSGTVAENIARFEENADSNKIIKASKLAAAHDLMLSLPEGYDTQISAGGRLSGGQLQRIGLARAFYGDPIMLVLDEPNSSLDETGNRALNQAIANARQQGKITLVISHRPSALAECNKVLMLDDGQMRAFGPREQVLNQVVRPVRKSD